MSTPVVESGRRDFVKKLGLFAGASAFTVFDATAFTGIKHEPVTGARGAPTDEDFWFQVQKAYNQSPHFVNLEAGYFSPQPLEVMEGLKDNIEMINEQPSFYMRTRMNKENPEVKRLLAEFAGTTPEEVVITRNTTESLNTIILGYPWQKGDEAIITDQDYPNMVQAFRQAEKRHGIQVKTISLPLHPTSDQDIVQAYQKVMTSKTKVLLVTHMINLTGQILPVQKICQMAHQQNVEVIVDGAHTFAHLDFKIPDLEADYYGASLHKWLCCPLGLGIMYVKREKIEKLWPLFGDTIAPVDSIQKFERTGTRPIGSNLTIANAIKFHEAIGSKRKEERLRYLKNYWCHQVKDLERVSINTPLEAGRSCAIANVRVKGMSPIELSKVLYEDFRIFTVAINRDSVKGVRITPHLYTRIEDLDNLVAAINKIAVS